METFLKIKNRYFFIAIFIVWIIGLFVAKFDVALQTSQEELFKIPRIIMNGIFLLWILQKVIKFLLPQNTSA
jgi:flagellar biosynthesis protein FliQ